MEFVIAEKRRPFKWYCDGAYYVCYHGDKEVSRIEGAFLPDPSYLRERRKTEALRLPPEHRARYRTEPDPVTVGLWNDYQKRRASMV